jgi:hypothetical protein
MKRRDFLKASIATVAGLAAAGVASGAFELEPTEYFEPYQHCIERLPLTDKWEFRVIDQHNSETEQIRFLRISFKCNEHGTYRKIVDVAMDGKLTLEMVQKGVEQLHAALTGDWITLESFLPFVMHQPGDSQWQRDYARLECFARHLPPTKTLFWELGTRIGAGTEFKFLHDEIYLKHSDNLARLLTWLGCVTTLQKSMGIPMVYSLWTHTPKQIAEAGIEIK